MAVRASALSLLVALSSCAGYPELGEPVFPAESCTLETWRPSHPEFSHVALVHRDSLDRPLERRGRPSPRPISRPAGFPPGYEAWVVVAMIVDSTGAILYREPVAVRMSPGIDSVRLRPGFERSAIDLLSPYDGYHPPVRDGRVVNAFACFVASFRER